MKNRHLVRWIAKLVAAAGLSAAVWAQTDPCPGGGETYEGVYVVLFCRAHPAQMCSTTLWFWTESQACGVWCCPNGYGDYVYETSNCGPIDSDGCCFTNGSMQVQDAPSCVQGQ